jgi:hypothetical protein
MAWETAGTRVPPRISVASGSFGQESVANMSPLSGALWAIYAFLW